MSHAVHKITHGIKHVFHEIVKHPLESLAVIGGSLLIPGNPLGAAIGIGGSTTAATGLATMGAMPDTALGAATATGALGSLGAATTTGAMMGSVLSTAGDVAKVAAAATGALNMTKKPKIDIPAAEIQQKTIKPKVAVSGSMFNSLLGQNVNLFGLTRTKFGSGSFASSIQLGDKFSLL